MNHCADMPTFFRDKIMTKEVWMLFSTMILPACPRQCWGKWSPDSLSSLFWSQTKTWLDRYTGLNFPTDSTRREWELCALGVGDTGDGGQNCSCWLFYVIDLILMGLRRSIIHSFLLLRKLLERKDLGLYFTQEWTSALPLNIAADPVKH